MSEEPSEELPEERSAEAPQGMSPEPVAEQPFRLAGELADLGLGDYVLQLEMDGLAVVPQAVHGVTDAAFDTMVAALLARAEAMVGCPFSLDRGPSQPVTFPTPEANRFALADKQGEPSQFLIQKLGSLHKAFRDLAINPVAIALMQHMIGRQPTRFSSHNAFIKWQGDYGYGPSLGLHADQQALPLPWGRQALTANTNWCLTDYNLDGGALAYVPGSHRYGTRPVFPDAVKKAVPVEAPRGSLIVFHGATWHGAFPRKLPGMRISIANYYRHAMVTSQEDIQNGFDQALAEDCDNPAMFRSLAGFADEFPYREPRQPIPKVNA